MTKKITYFTTQNMYLAFHLYRSVNYETASWKPYNSVTKLAPLTILSNIKSLKMLVQHLNRTLSADLAVVRDICANERQRQNLNSPETKEMRPPTVLVLNHHVFYH